MVDLLVTNDEIQPEEIGRNQVFYGGTCLAFDLILLFSAAGSVKICTQPEIFLQSVKHMNSKTRTLINIEAA